MGQLHPRFTQYFERYHQDAWLFKSSTHWMANAGSVLVARVDRKPLAPPHLKLLIRFIDNIIDMLGFQILESATRGPYSIIELTGRLFVTAKEPICASDVLAQITPREFKEFYMAQCALNREFFYPTPWAWSIGRFRVSKRNAMLHKYTSLSLEDRVTNAGSSKERYLRTEIHELKSRLGEAEDRLRGGLEEVDWALIRRRIKRTLEDNH